MVQFRSLRNNGDSYIDLEMLDKQLQAAYRRRLRIWRRARRKQMLSGRSINSIGPKPEFKPRQY